MRNLEMAGLKKFVVPSLEEMETAYQENPPEALFTKVKESSVKAKYGTSTPMQTEMVNKDIGKPTNTVEVTEHSIGKQTAESITIQNDNTSERTNTNQTSTEGQEAAGSSISVKPLFSNSLIVNTRQRGNPILKSVRNIPWEYGNIIPDYVMGQSNCALFLSLRYHQLHPNYIHERLKQLGKSYELRVLLVQVDVKESHHLLKDLAKICLLADCTLILAFSPEEAGRYLETYKIFENKPPESIMEKTEENFIAKFTDCLTRVKSVNKTDCLTLISHFKTLANVMDSSEEDLSLCPGFGPQKAKRLHSIFHEPFVKPSHSGTHTS